MFRLNRFATESVDLNPMLADGVCRFHSVQESIFTDTVKLSSAYPTTPTNFKEISTLK